MRLRIAILCLLLASALADERVVKIFQLANRPAEATVEMVLPLLSPEGTVMAETRLNKLIVQDTPEVIARVETLLAEIDQPAPQVRVFVTMNGVSPIYNSQAGVGVSGRGNRIRVTGNAGVTEGVSSSNSQSNLLIMSGERGVILLGQNLVDVNPYYSFAARAGLVPPGVVFREVSTGFAVEPRVIGDTVTMTISPWMGYLSGKGRGEIVFNEASTTVSLKSGDSTIISSGSFTEEVRSQTYGLIFGSGTQTSGNSASITVQPVIQE